ncbi:hypothetical protein DKM44_01035 [Deinococcus irradiatisoli]|uniref:Uncharacterized protein n=1 Tax=Deinococcus irradiatisoli TaxID=2202254 RepID=A0A2Z3JD76_9DEIO|nr:hypothetical protein [Deinococcus irradiatisoli]AWN21996.1 hypothetical protein DKM44_01035 [Deinococcus irradiatisoli]
MGYRQVQWRNRRARRLQQRQPGPFPWIWKDLSLSEIKRHLLYHSQNLRSHGGGKPYKRRYHQVWGQQARQFERLALIGDELGFERICPDGTRGAIGWDWW